MQFIDKESLFVNKISLAKGIEYDIVFDMNFNNTGRIQKIGEYVRISKGETFLLLKSLIIVPLAEYKGNSKDKREFAQFLQDKIETKKYYLERVGNRLTSEIKEYFTNKNYQPPFINTDTKKVWMEVPVKWVWMVDILNKKNIDDDFPDITPKTDT